MNEFKYNEYINLYKKKYININTEKQIRNFKIYNNIFIAKNKLEQKNNKWILTVKNAIKQFSPENKWLKEVNELLENYIYDLVYDNWKKLNINEDEVINYGKKLFESSENQFFLSGSHWYNKLEEKNFSVNDMVAGIIINQLDMCSKLINKDVRKITKDSKHLEFNGQCSTERIKNALKISQKSSGIYINQNDLETYILDYNNYKLKNDFFDKVYKLFSVYLMVFLKIKQIANDNYNNGINTSKDEINPVQEFDFLYEKLKVEDLWK